MRLILIRTAAIVTAGILLNACASTQLIEPKDSDMVEKADEALKEGVISYPDEIAGTIEALYGSDLPINLSEAQRRSIEEDPALRYNIIYFEYDSSIVSQLARKLLQKHANYLLENPDVFVILEGHTDKRGSGTYNYALGERRAISVMRTLFDFGLPASQLSVVSFGEEKPAVVGNSAKAFDKNRRVEIVYR